MIIKFFQIGSLIVATVGFIGLTHSQRSRHFGVFGGLLTVGAVLFAISLKF